MRDVNSVQVLTADGFTYERSAIEQWLRTTNRSPMTGAELPNTSFFPVIALKQLIAEFLEKHPQHKR